MEPLRRSTADDIYLSWTNSKTARAFWYKLVLRAARCCTNVDRIHFHGNSVALEQKLVVNSEKRLPRFGRGGRTQDQQASMSSRRKSSGCRALDFTRSHFCRSRLCPAASRAIRRRRLDPAVEPRSSGCPTLLLRFAPHGAERRGVRRTRHARCADDGARSRRARPRQSIQPYEHRTRDDRPRAQRRIPAMPERPTRCAGSITSRRGAAQDHGGFGVRRTQHARRAHDGADPGQPAGRHQSDSGLNTRRRRRGRHRHFDGEPVASGSDGQRGKERRVVARDEPCRSRQAAAPRALCRVALSQRRGHAMRASASSAHS